MYAFRTKQPSGRFLEVPYEFRAPTASRVRERLWNPDDRRILTPPVFGIGWSVNLYHAATMARALLGLRGKVAARSRSVSPPCPVVQLVARRSLEP